MGVTFGIHRCDYMLHVDDAGEIDPSAKLVEINTISVSGFGYSQEIALLHKFIQHQHQDQLQDTIAKHYSGEIAQCCDSEGVICNAMAQAWGEYKQSKAALLMVVKENEVNIYGQRRFESTMVLKHQIKVIRHSLTELCEIATLNKEKKLIVNGTEVALVYYRAGYDPVDYPCDKEWNMRLLIENSRAIKCPSISYHLLTTKKIQQVLSNQNVLEKYDKQ